MTEQSISKRWNWQLVRCFHRGGIKVIKLDASTTRIMCTSCHSELFRYTKYADYMTSVDEELARKMFVIGKPRELTAAEREYLR